jgi:hypothetical protein
MPVIIVMGVLLFSLVAPHGDKSVPPPRWIGLLPFVMMPLMLALQTFAMKLALKAQLAKLQAIRHP